MSLQRKTLWICESVKAPPYWGWGEERIGIPGYMGNGFWCFKSWKLTFKGESYMCVTWLGKMDRV